MAHNVKNPIECGLVDGHDGQCMGQYEIIGRLSFVILSMAFIYSIAGLILSIYQVM